MNIEEMLNKLSKNMAKMMFHKEKNSDDIINVSNASSDDFLPIVIKNLIYKKDYNKAEDILFEEIHKNASERNYKLALNFYNILSEKSDAELKESNFSKDEIFQGLNDLEKIYK